MVCSVADDSSFGGSFFSAGSAGLASGGFGVSCAQAAAGIIAASASAKIAVHLEFRVMCFAP